jgi:hypothetical protein
MRYLISYSGLVTSYVDDNSLQVCKLSSHEGARLPVGLAGREHSKICSSTYIPPPIFTVWVSGVLCDEPPTSTL